MASERVRRRRRMPHERRVFLLALAAGLPAVLTAIVLLWATPHAARTRWTLALAIGGAWLGFAAAARARVTHPLQTLSNMLAALREGDFSMRGRDAGTGDALGLAFHEANLLSETLHQERLGALEAGALLRRVMEEIDAAVFAFDAARRLQLVNPAGARLLGRPAESLLGRGAADLGLADALAIEGPRVLDFTFPGGAGRWAARRGEFRQAGVPHTLVVLSDVSRTLREAEWQAWQRLVRVLTHEINNSLAPIKSIAQSLRTGLADGPAARPSAADLDAGLQIVVGRAESLSRFLAAYARLARLPRPSPAPIAVGPWVRRIAGLETRVPVAVEPGPEVTVAADADQLDQMLINLVRNAADAVLEARAARGGDSGGVRVRWRTAGPEVEVEVEDDGPGLPDSDNLFVPFFTTKPNGTGVGLALSRQIAEAHGGALALRNRAGRAGCCAGLRLPAAGRPAAP